MPETQADCPIFLRSKSNESCWIVGVAGNSPWDCLVKKEMMR
jgi:hypothetical protein